MEHLKMPKSLHKGKEMKEYRRNVQSTREMLTTPNKSLEKSKRRMAEKMSKYKPKYPRDFKSDKEQATRENDYSQNDY